MAFMFDKSILICKQLDNESKSENVIIESVRPAHIMSIQNLYCLYFDVITQVERSSINAFLYVRFGVDHSSHARKQRDHTPVFHPEIFVRGDKVDLAGQCMVNNMQSSYFD